MGKHEKVLQQVLLGRSDAKAKPYQVRQVRAVIPKYKVGVSDERQLRGHHLLERGRSGFHRREAPELPGCMADGSTYQAALANLEVVMQQWIETASELGRPIPQPRGRLMFA